MEKEINNYDSLAAPWTASGQNTRLSLLQRMNAEQIDELTWQQFFRKYSPFVIMMGKSAGLSRDEIKELWSKVFVEISQKGIGSYDREKGSFRSWFKALIKFRALDLLRKRASAKEIPTEDILTSQENESDSSHPDDEYEKIWQKMLLYSLVLDLKDELDPIHFQIFFMVVLQGRKPQDVAAVCNVKANTASQIVSRITKKLHESYTELQKENPIESMSDAELIAKEAALHKEYHAIEKEYAELMR
jgi:RNA polymerase sigma factor (sigma-70 family)